MAADAASSEQLGAPQLLMRLTRILALALSLVILVVAVLAVVASYNQDRLLRFVLAQAKSGTGLEIIPSSGAIELRSHLVVVLRHPRLLAGGSEIARATQVRALVSYHSLIYSGGLPFYALLLDYPQITITPPRAAPGLSALPRFDASTVAAIARARARFSSVARRIEIRDGSVISDRGEPLANHLDLRAYTQRHLRRSPWRVKFSFTWAADPIPGAQWSGDFSLGLSPGPSPTVAKGRLWVWNVKAGQLTATQAVAAGEGLGQLTFTVLADGRADGSVRAEIRGLALKGAAPIPLGDYALHAALAASPNRIELTDLSLRQRTTLLLAGQCRLEDPYGPDPRIALLLGGLEADLVPVARVVKSASSRLPGWLVELADRVSSGQIQVDELSFDSNLSELRRMEPPLLRRFSIDARLERVNVAFPPDLKIPPLRQVSAQLSYTHGLFLISQGSARAGNSALSDIQIRVDLTSDFERAPYRVRLDGEVDLADLYPSVAAAASRFGSKPDQWITATSGTASLELSLSGQLAGMKLKPPAQYLVMVEPRDVEVSLKSPAKAATIDGGRATFTPPGRLALDHLSLELKPGRAVVDGEIDLDGGIRLHDLGVELQQVPAQAWLPLAIDPSQLTAEGNVDGRMLVNADSAQAANFTVTGSLHLSPGKMKFGFIRSPMFVRSATATFGGRNAVLTMPAAILEGAPVDLKIGVSDLQKPVLRIDAVAQKLDLEAITLVRLPWTPKSNVIFLGGAKASGHVEARRGNLSKLELSDLKGDFRRDDGDWSVTNLHATSLGGRVDMEIIGRAQDDWVQMKGRVAGMDAGALFRLTGSHRPPLRGSLYADFDLWGDTGVHFFDTLAGKASLGLKDGKLEKFTLLSRLLGLIDLKNWLSAQVPDPRATGLPFNFVTADFAGSDGSFYTKNLVLDGPVMDITAEGGIDVGDNTLAMEIGALPFQTVNWLVKSIPLIGENLGSSRILAAYFRVEGPIADPRITPEPVTSAAEIVKKTLGLPLNLIRPNTVK